MGFVERFNGRPRDECPNEHFTKLNEVRQISKAWRIDTNQPHTSSTGSRQLSSQHAPKGAKLEQLLLL
jgi:hypothetical protein